MTEKGNLKSGDIYENEFEGGASPRMPIAVPELASGSSEKKSVFEALADLDLEQFCNGIFGILNDLQAVVILRALDKDEILEKFNPLSLTFELIEAFFFKKDKRAMRECPLYQEVKDYMELSVIKAFTEAFEYSSFMGPYRDRSLMALLLNQLGSDPSVDKSKFAIAKAAYEEISQSKFVADLRKEYLDLVYGVHETKVMVDRPSSASVESEWDPDFKYEEYEDLEEYERMQNSLQ